MTITVTFIADDGSDLRRQMLNLLGMYAADSLTPYAPGKEQAQPDRPGAGDIVGRPFDATKDVGFLGDATHAPQEPVQRDKPRRAHRRVRPVEAPVAAPVATPAPQPDPLEEAIDQLVDQVDPLDALDVDEDAGIQIDTRRAVDNELLKREVIASLSDMFTAGNVKVVRHVLHKYGHGAKSFPEIDPAHFPEIKAALDRNEAA